MTRLTVLLTSVTAAAALTLTGCSSNLTGLGADEINSGQQVLSFTPESLHDMSLLFPDLNWGQLEKAEWKIETTQDDTVTKYVLSKPYKPADRQVLDEFWKENITPEATTEESEGDSLRRAAARGEYLIGVSTDPHETGMSTVNLVVGSDLQPN